jgi:integrase
MHKVHLRKAILKKGMTSLYLDFYPPLTRPDTLKSTRREFLGLHLYTTANTQDRKQHNSETLALAEAIKSQRQVDIQNGFYGFISSKGKAVTVIEYFMEQAKKRGGKDDSWLSSAHHIKRYFGTRDVRLSELTTGHCEKYREYLLYANSLKSPSVKIQTNSAASYFNKFKAMLKQAYKEGLFKSDLNSRIDRIRETDTVREFLTIEDLKMLKITECKSPILKVAALFSALSGLRFGDLQKLVWGNVRHSELMGHTIHFRQSKTGGVEVLPVSDEAIELLGERGTDEEPILKGLKYSAYMNVYLKTWIANAGIQKNISFHCFRHTYATLQIAFGTDIYTVSKLLGHKNIKTTQIYAKVVDQKKLDAANRISLL